MLIFGLVLSLILATAPSPAISTGNVGDFAPDFTLENVLDFAPDSFTLSDNLGSVVVLAFFAEW
jgi:hypothetical protein